MARLQSTVKEGVRPAAARRSWMVGGLLAAGLAAALAWAAFAPRKVHVGVSIPAATHGWAGGVVYWAERSKKELEARHPRLRVTVRTAVSAAEQASQVERLHSQAGIDTLVVLPFESGPLTAPVAAVKDRGVDVTVFDRGLTDAQAQHAYVAGDNAGFGRIAAEYLVQQLGGRGEVVVLRGIPTVIDTQRFDAFRAALQGSQVQLLEAQHANWNRDDAHRAMQGLLRRHAKVDAVWAADDDMAVGAQRAIDEARRSDVRVLLGGAGAKGQIQKIMEGHKLVTANVTYGPSMVGEAIRLTAEARLAGRTLPASTIIPSVLVTRDNADRFYFPESPY